MPRSAGIQRGCQPRARRDQELKPEVVRANRFTPTKLLIAQILVVFTIMIAGAWAATQWAAAATHAYQPEVRLSFPARHRAGLLSGSTIIPRAEARDSGG